MRLVLMLLLLAGCARTEKPAAPRGKVSAEIADKGPRLVGNPPTVQIELPPRMTAVLAESDTSFATLTPFDFVDPLSPASGPPAKGDWTYPYDGRQAPFAVIADFDGDGRDDVALLQHSASTGRVIVVFDSSDGPKVARTKEWSRITAGDAGNSGFYLSRFPAGPYKVPDFGGSGDTSKTVKLAHEGIEISNYGKTATTYWWTGEKFDHVTTGD